MNKHLKMSIFVTLVLSTLLILSTSLFASNQDDVKIRLDDEIFYGHIKDGRTLVPVRYISEALGGEVSYDESERKVTVLKINGINKKSLILRIDQTKMVVNGQEKYTDVAPIIINNRTYIPIRVLAENIGFSVKWDGDSKTVILNAIEENPINLSNIEDNDSFDDCIINVNYPKFDGLENKTIEDKINNIFKEYAIGFKEERLKDIEEFKEFRSSEVLDADERSDVLYGVWVYYSVTYNQKDFISVVFDSMYSFGGAHPANYKESYIINIKTGEQYRLYDFFKQFSENQIKPEYEEMLKSEIANFVKPYMDDYVSNTILEPLYYSQYCYLSNDGIVLFIPPDKELPHVYGSPEVIILYDEEIMNY